ncbi:MAG TPA: hypothetical protein VKR30_05045 [Candidatus Limnocylindrales bacterium]|nr:hypothetical protein [Candidatus Limnocylindrales bacterium]
MSDPDLGLDPLRQAPPGLPSGGDLRPPVVAESGDPFAALRVVDLVARLPRGRALAVAAIVDRLNAIHVDWLFDRRVVADALLQLEANWMSDYRNSAGFALSDDAGGPTLTIEDSTRVDPWIVRQSEREAARCREALVDFSRRDRVTGGD